MNVQHHQPDDPGPDYGPLTFTDTLGGRAAIYLGRELIGCIEPKSWLRVKGYQVTIHLGMKPRKVQASTPEQAKTFAMQEVMEWLARTPMRLEARV